MLTIVLQAEVFPDSAPGVVCGRVEWHGKIGAYIPTLIVGVDTVEQPPVSTFDEAVAVCAAHAAELDATVVDDKATTLSYRKQIAERDARIVDLEAQLAGAVKP